MAAEHIMHIAGERDRLKLASLCNGRVKSPRENVAKSLEGDYPSEHLFVLRQSVIGYRFYQKLIAEVDVELQLKKGELPRSEGGPEQIAPRTKKCFYQRAGNELAFDLKGERFRIAGLDLTDVSRDQRDRTHHHHGSRPRYLTLSRCVGFCILAWSLPREATQRWQDRVHSLAESKIEPRLR